MSDKENTHLNICIYKYNVDNINIFHTKLAWAIYTV